jgi:hypothetical protein
MTADQVGPQSPLKRKPARLGAIPGGRLGLVGLLASDGLERKKEPGFGTQARVVSGETCVGYRQPALTLPRASRRA